LGNVYSVLQVNSYIKRMFEEDFALGNITIKGEVSNCKYHSSGHIYFTLKEENSCLASVMFAGSRKGLNFPMKEGQKVCATGSVSVYERDGKYQLYAQKITLDGEGDLYKKFQQLKNELEEMGMFDSIYKKPIPKYARKVGIVTASTGAAIQDIINISTRRNPHISLYLYSAIVQGPEAKNSIIQGVETLDDMDLDVIIVGRGGGSIEDLWAFNEEEVARAIFNCNTPIISAVGHETDTTIADYVSDLRAPTPSAAAELAVFDYNDYLLDIQAIEQGLKKTLRGKYEKKRLVLEQYVLRLKNNSPIKRVQERKRDVKDIQAQLLNLMYSKLDVDKHRLQIYATRLHGLSPLNKLSSGYSYVSKDNKAITGVHSVGIGDDIVIDVTDGKIYSKIYEVEKVER